MSAEAEIRFALHAQQEKLLDTQATEVLYGGAAGGGKSHVVRVLSIMWALEIPGIQIYLFRRLYDDLIKNHIEGPTGFRAMLAPWLNGRNSASPLIGQRLAEMVQGEIRFWNGSKIFLCHLQHQKDITKYYGPDIHCLILEEATQFNEFMIRFLRGRLRIPDTLKIPEKYKGKFPRVIYTSNPGGVGHSYIKKGFVQSFSPYSYHNASTEDGGHLRQFIPAKVDDNPSVDREAVKANLRGLPKALVSALLDGNWDAIVGAFFPQIDREQHLIKPFLIPNHWPCFMSMDWGACGDGDPFSIGWYAIADGTTSVTIADNKEQMPCQRGSLICYRRWNGQGLQKQDAVTIAKGILQREKEQIIFRVAGGDILESRGHGETIFSLFAKEGVQFRRADMRRQNGWAQVDYRLTGENGYPLSFWFEECQEDLETIGNLQHDLNNPNDTAKGDDHDADRHRYACMMRPLGFAKDKPVEKSALEGKPLSQVTYGQLLDDHLREAKRARR